MAGYAATTIATLKALHIVLASLQNYLGFGNYLCPATSPVETIISNGPYQYIVVGAGEAGSIVANRLGETDASVLVLETGECPPLESLMAGLFTTIPLSSNDYAMNAYNDSYSCQNQQPDGGITAGKMLGGSGSLNHLIYVTPTASDYDSWGKAANDDSWTFPDFSYYFAKGENVQHEGALAQTSWHGTHGPALITKQESPSTADVIAAYVETGLTYKNDSDGQCVLEPLLFLGGGTRQCGNVPHLQNAINKKNVSFLTGATVTKIIIDGNTATGVEFTYNGTSYTVSATSKVIVTAGAIKTPQLLMLSGIGDKDKLESIGIPSVVDNKHVGQNLLDHTGALVLIALDKSTAATPAANPAMWPVPMVTAYAALTPEETTPTIQDIGLLFPPNSSGFLQLCTYGFKYRDEICDAWYEYNIDRNVLYVVKNLMRPKSRGSVELASANITVQPIIKLNHLSESDDLDLFADHGLAFSKILDTKPMKSLNAELADVGVCKEHKKNSLEFWRCYMLAMSSTMWHYSGTCAMGAVVDSSLSIIGVDTLKVADASVFPAMVTGNIGSTVRAVAEKAADIIKKEDGLTKV